MESDGLRQRSPPQMVPTANDANPQKVPHPGGRIKHGVLVQGLRLILLLAWSSCCCATVHLTQLLGSPLYLFDKDYYYAYMALTKQSFGILLTSLVEWWSPTIIRVSGDKSVKGQLRLTKDGRLETDFPERLVMIANHQLYSDWLYLWWIAYTSRMHGHIFIVLKQSLKYIPVIGPGMMFYGFIFMARNWAKDKSRMHHRLKQLTTRHSGPMSGSQPLDPMWLLIFPEGTNLSANTRKGSAKWAEKQGIADLRHLLLPRSTGLQFCLSELNGSVEWVYDCTTAYEGVPRGGYGQDYFTLRSTFFQGRPPKSVNMYWRRFAVSSIPIHNPKAFEKWIKTVWMEKEVILEYFAQNGRFPADEDATVEQEALQRSLVKKANQGGGFLETEVKLASVAELGQIFVVLAGFAAAAFILAKVWDAVMHGSST